jgi:chemotaxis protein methyltransferase WspC
MNYQIKNPPDMETSLAKIKIILKREIGLDASTIGEATINKILNERMRSCNISELDEYYIYLSNNRQELPLLLETSVIPETWFFRDDKPFKLILEKISRQLLTYSKTPCRILCIPCSTGEEPYSISMFLHSNGMPETAFEIQAVDISHNSIGIARQGVYSKNSFRGIKAKEYINDYFTLSGSEYFLNEKIKSSIEFNRVNILDASALPFENKFDFILCRNLLIYFDIPTKEVAYKNMDNMLNDDGVLFIGHSEFGSVPEHIFTTTKLDSVFCLTKNKNPINKKEIGKKPCKNKKNKHSILKLMKPPEKKAFSDSERYKKNTPEPKANIIQKTSSDKKSAKNLLKQARTLADQGKLGQAESLCHEYIDKSGDHEDSFFLLGLINEASGNNTQAHNFYKKSLYLNPKHYETLIHLALIVEKEGDIETAKRLKERAERALKQ